MATETMAPPLGQTPTAVDDSLPSAFGRYDDIEIHDPAQATVERRNPLGADHDSLVRGPGSSPTGSPPGLSRS